VRLLHSTVKSESNAEYLQNYSLVSG